MHRVTIACLYNLQLPGSCHCTVLVHSGVQSSVECLDYCRPKPLHSTFNYKATSVRKPSTETLVMEFFGDQRRVASRRHRTTPQKPQCTASSGQNSSWTKSASGAEWQTFTLQSDNRVETTGMHDPTSKHSMYISGCGCMKWDLVLSILLLLGACILCSLNGRQRNNKQKDPHVQLICWPR